jgi:hypothetical protein
VIAEPALASFLSQYRGLSGVQVTAHNGGIGSETWFADLGDRRWVAKAVAPGDGRSFAGGMAIARRLDQAGIPVGAPVPARRGQLAVNIGDAWLALRPWLRPAIRGHPAPARLAEAKVSQEAGPRPGRAGSCTGLPCCLSGHG